MSSTFNLNNFFLSIENINFDNIDLKSPIHRDNCMGTKKSPTGYRDKFFFFNLVHILHRVIISTHVVTVTQTKMSVFIYKY